MILEWIMVRVRGRSESEWVSERGGRNAGVMFNLHKMGHISGGTLWSSHHHVHCGTGRCCNLCKTTLSGASAFCCGSSGGSVDRSLLLMWGSGPGRTDVQQGCDRDGLVSFCWHSYLWAPSPRQPESPSFTDLYGKSVKSRQRIKLLVTIKSNKNQKTYL